MLLVPAEAAVGEAKQVAVVGVEEAAAAAAAAAAFLVAAAAQGIYKTLGAAWGET